MEKQIVPSFVDYLIEDWEEEYLAYEIMDKCVSGIGMSIDKETTENKRQLQCWLEENPENLLVLTKAILYGYEVEDKKN